MILRVGTVYDTEAFKTLYSYDGDDLGVSYAPDSSRFLVWAPTASAVNLLLYENGTPCGDEPIETVPMSRSSKGTWTAAVPRDLKGIFYTYQVFANSVWREAVDPYAKAVGLNGLRGQIIDLYDTDPAGWDSDLRVTPSSPVDAVIYELHVRDLSVHPDSGIKHKGKFLGLSERGTTTPEGVKTGLDHILDLGATHIHLLPIYDFRTVEEDKEQFNWGYDPQNYNTPEGSYSTNPRDGAVRIRELKQTVKAIHDSGLGLIMDVVYNHVYSAQESCLESVVPGYFFRTTEDGELSDGSACGNETASERYMVRKYIADSVVYWAKEYHLDGFRFDLMGLHDIETMNYIRARLDEIDPSILMYGEGWTGGDSPLPVEERAIIANASKLNRVAVFNDKIRDGIKGSVFLEDDQGFVSGDYTCAKAVKSGIKGEDDPLKFVTYCSAHDNHALWDKLSLTCDDKDKLEAMNRLAAAIVLTSQGIPFFQAGEEMARTKGGDENSYRSPDSVNQLDWNRKSEFIELYNYYKGLIALRKAHPEFRLRGGVDSKLRFINTGSESMIAYELDSSFIIVFNAAEKEQVFTLPNGVWNVLVNGTHSGTAVLGTVEGTLKAAPISAYVLKKSGEGTQTPEPEEVKGTYVTATITAGPASATGCHAHKGCFKTAAGVALAGVTLAAIAAGIAIKCIHRAIRSKKQ